MPPCPVVEAKVEGLTSANALFLWAVHCESPTPVCIVLDKELDEAYPERIRISYTTLVTLQGLTDWRHGISRPP
jgi:hypothetical protein